MPRGLSRRLEVLERIIPTIRNIVRAKYAPDIVPDSQQILSLIARVLIAETERSFGRSGFFRRLFDFGAGEKLIDVQRGSCHPAKFAKKILIDAVEPTEKAFEIRGCPHIGRPAWYKRRAVIGQHEDACAPCEQLLYDHLRFSVRDAFGREFDAIEQARPREPCGENASAFPGIKEPATELRHAAQRADDRRRDGDLKHCAFGIDPPRVRRVTEEVRAGLMREAARWQHT